MVIVLMGVTGAGKTTVGNVLADRLGWTFYDADDFHPEENVSKMRAGIPLDDDDREPWLEQLRTLVESSLTESKNIVLACSALKQRYRENLVRGFEGKVRFVFLRGEQDLIRERLEARKGHYMNPTLLPTQFAALEEPHDALYMDVSPPPEEIALTICRELKLS